MFTIGYLVVSLFGLFFDPEDGGNIFLQNVRKLLPDYIESHPISSAMKTLNLTCIK
jgi:hypothetical protein